jgi:hypothetical protein
MESHVLETLTLRTEAVVWEKKNKELNIGGRLFDVKVISESEGIYTVTGFYDDTETGIVHLLSYLTGKGKESALLQLVLAVQCFFIPLILFAFLLPTQRHVYHDLLRFLLTAPYRHLAERPPQG